MEIEEKELADTQVEESLGSEPEIRDEEPVKEEKDFKKLSAREAVRDAFEKQKAKEEIDDTKPKAKDRKPKQEEPEDKEEPEAEAKTSDKPVKDIVKDKTADKPPPGWTKGGKAKWDALDPEIRESVLKREKEVSDGFADYGKKTKELEEINTIFGPREAELARLGVSKSQMIANMVQWVDALSGSNKLNHWLQLGKNYGITDEALKEYYTKGNQTPQTTQAQTTQTQSQGQPNPELLEVKTQLNQLQQNIANQQQADSDALLANWAQDKPHYQKVRHTMYALFQSGQLKLSGIKDLDEAYSRACYADPSVRAELKAAEAEAEETEAKQVAAKKEAERIVRLNKARNASTSIKSGSPASPSNAKTAKPKNVSVADSIRMAMQEVRAD